MYAVEFEADIDDGIVRVPIEFKEIYKTHAKVMITVQSATQNVDSEKSSIVKKTSGILAHLHIDPIAYQASMREDR
jgi:hypothetical protein